METVDVHAIGDFQELQKLVRKELSAAERPIYAQIATVSENGEPRARTVHLRYLDSYHSPGFVCHIDSPKWHELQHKPVLAGCWFDPEKRYQMRWRGFVECIAPDQASVKQFTLLDNLWSQIRPDVRLSYWLDELGVEATQLERARGHFDERSPHFGCVICRPTVWDCYLLGEGPYYEGERFIFEERNGTWHKAPVSLIHTHSLSQ